MDLPLKNEEEVCSDIAFNKAIEIDYSNDLKTLFLANKIKDVFYWVHGYFSVKVTQNEGWHEDFDRDCLYEAINYFSNILGAEWENGSAVNEDGVAIVDCADDIVSYISFSERVSDATTAEFLFYYLSFIKLHGKENNILISNDFYDNPREYLLKLSLTAMT